MWFRLSGGREIADAVTPTLSSFPAFQKKGAQGSGGIAIQIVHLFQDGLYRRGQRQPTRVVRSEGANRVTNDATRTIVIGNWDKAGSYSRKCWEEIARQFASEIPDGAFAAPWNGGREYLRSTESPTTFLPIPLAAPESSAGDKNLFRDTLFTYLNYQNVTSLVLVCDSPYARRTLDLLGPLTTRPIFIAVASNNELLSSKLSALADDYLFRLCPNNRQQAELVLMRTRLAEVSTLLFWTAEKEGSDEYLYHAEDLKVSLDRRSQVLDIAFREWHAAMPARNAALFVAGYSATVGALERISAPLAEAKLVIFSDGCTPFSDLKKATATRGRDSSFAIRSSVDPNRIASHTVWFLRRNETLTPRELAASVKHRQLLASLPVSFPGIDNAAIPFHLTDLAPEGA